MYLPGARQLSVALLAVVLAAGPVLAQDGSSPSAEPPASPEPAPSVAPGSEAVEEVEMLGGSWRRLDAAPFGAIDIPGGWTGTELVIVDPDRKRRASSYLPALDRWSKVAKPPRKLLPGTQAHWTGTELLFIEPRGTMKRGLTVFDPVADRWRRSAVAPLNEIGASAWAGDRLVVAASTGGRVATYDPAADEWTELPAPEDALVTSLHQAAEDVLALARTGEGETLAFIPLDLEAGSWGEPTEGPLTPASSPVLWIGDAFISLSPTGLPESAPTPEGASPAPDGASPAPERASPTPESPEDSAPTAETPGAAAEDAATLGEPTELPAVNATYDPATLEWTEIENACAIDTERALWADPLILDIDAGAGLDPATGECYRLPESKWGDRSGALRVWTGNEVVDVSGDTGGKRPRRDGVAYDPYPGDDKLGVRLNKGSRPVRVTVPSLGIDLPVISTERKVAGSTPGYPACDVALSWSVFDRPGKPGTAWIMAHAQQGMFLPLLRTLTDDGKHALLGREVDVQLRDGRVLTYRTYRANARAINTNLGRKGRMKGEHRLVLQTSTGIGTAPKLLIAARLVDVGTTDEPRPKPRPRACG